MTQNIEDIIENFTLPVIIYHPNYNVRFWGFEKFHSLDTCKYEKIAKKLKHDNFHLEFLMPEAPVSNEELINVHSKAFLNNLNTSKQTIVITSEVCIFYFFTWKAIREKILKPLRFQVSGTLLTCEQAWKNGSAINLGGGFHHCSGVSSGGFCFFADITLAIYYVWNNIQNDASILIVDCDAHQGNGYAKDILFRMNKHERLKIFILDFYNPRIYPNDIQAKEAIDREVCLPLKVEDDEYLKLLKYHLNAVISIDKYFPNFIIYNAGSDILYNDPLGKLSVSGRGLIERDRFVFEFAKKHKTPIAMLLSGGYSKKNWLPVANSINSLLKSDIL